MAKGEKEEINQADNVVSYFKSLTLEKKYGTTGSIEMEHGAVYIGDKSFEKQALRSSCELLRTKDSKRSIKEQTGTFRNL